jgi:hypothetical protein
LKRFVGFFRRFVCPPEKRGLLNISFPWQIQAQEETAIISWRECSKKAVQQGHSYFDARSIHGVRERGKMARTPLAAFFNILKSDPGS